MFTEYLQQYCPKVERLGFDENFLDITDLVRDRLANQTGESETGVMGHVYGEEPSVLGNIIRIYSDFVEQIDKSVLTQVTGTRETNLS